MASRKVGVDYLAPGSLQMFDHTGRCRPVFTGNDVRVAPNSDITGRFSFRCSITRKTPANQRAGSDTAISEFNDFNGG